TSQKAPFSTEKNRLETPTKAAMPTSASCLHQRGRLACSLPETGSSLTLGMAFMRCVYFLITIDTEADNGWARQKELTTKNARFLPKFQELCESYDFKPTYLTTYEMALDPFFQEFGRDVITRRQGEIGAHLHAWSSPPLVSLTEADYRFLPYITEYPDYLVRQKTAYLTGVLEETFQVDMVSHRGGRWGFNAVSARALVENG